VPVSADRRENKLLLSKEGRSVMFFRHKFLVSRKDCVTATDSVMLLKASYPVEVSNETLAKEPNCYRGDEAN
jgi:hypothetical protein